MNCQGEGSRLGAPYEDLMLDDLILLYGEKSGKLEVGGASRDSTGFGALEEGLISS